MNPPANYELALLRAIARWGPVRTPKLPLPATGGIPARRQALARLVETGHATRRNVYGLFSARTAWEYDLTDAGRAAVRANSLGAA